MNAQKEFDIFIRQKVPFLSRFLYSLTLLFFAFLFLLYLVMLPAKNASGEMATAYYILVVPEALKRLSAYSGIGLLLVLPLYYYARLQKPATLTIQNDLISITGKGVGRTIPIRKMDRIYFNDVKTVFGKPKGILQMVIRQKRRKLTTFRLRHYDQSAALLEACSTFEKITFAFYDKEMMADHDDG
ncbi:hypothetical protein V9K67_13350 [Paraflavisolibacter sp. H34]|uniref:hypothetical protein n=1 Tax=Huijunlia imazamoxiresistens TaxID=3127457 RepID=UPI003018AB26